MPDPIRPTTPSPSGTPAGAAPPAAGTTLGDHLGELARRRAPRPRAIRALYAAVAAFAVVYLVGTLAGWWGSPVADKVRARREREARDASKASTPTGPAPGAPQAPGTTPVAPR